MAMISEDSEPLGAATSQFAAGPGEPGLVSVVIPTFNRAYILPSAIDSALRQTYGRIEVIVVDDGSTDDTAGALARYDERVRLVRQPNAGPSAARNTGLRKARGEFICLLDSDDQWLPWKVEAQVNVLRAFPEVGMVWTDMTAIDEHGLIRHPRYLRKFYSAYRKTAIEQVLPPRGALSQFWPAAPEGVGQDRVLVGDLFSQIVLGNLVHTSTTMLRRSRLRATGPFDEALSRSGEDYDFHLRTTMHGPVALVDAPGILYRIDASDQLTGPEYAIDRARNNLTTVEKCIAANAGRIRLSQSELRRRMAEAYTWLGETELACHDAAAARRSLLRSLRQMPTMRSALLFLMSVLPAPHAVFSAIRYLKRRIGRLGIVHH